MAMILIMLLSRATPDEVVQIAKATNDIWNNVKPGLDS